MKNHKRLKKRKTKAVPPPTRNEINQALKEYFSRGGTIKKIEIEDYLDPRDQSRSFNPFGNGVGF